MAIALALCACSPKAETSSTAKVVYRIDCTPGFEALKAKIARAPGTVAAPKTPGEPYDWYSTADGAASYVITEPGAPGHPAILMQVATGGGRELTTGCAYGDKAGFDKLKAYVESLKGARR